MIVKAIQTRFLVVDDFETMRNTLRNNIKEMGYEEVHLAANGREAIDVLEKTPIDFIISDWNMPILDGLELLQYVRSSEKHNQLYFVLVTAESNRESINKAISEGISNFIVKPFTQATLRTKIKATLARSPLLQGFHKHEDTEEKTQSTQPLMDEDTRRKRVLVVDDVPANVDVIVGFLKDNYQIIAATSGEKALEIVNSHQIPDLILLDIMMPKMDGMECNGLMIQDTELDIIIKTNEVKNEFKTNFYK